MIEGNPLSHSGSGNFGNVNPVYVSKPPDGVLKYDLAVDAITGPTPAPGGKQRVTVTVKNIGECNHDFPAHYTQRTLKLFQNGKEVGSGTIQSPLFVNQLQEFRFDIPDFPQKTNFEAKITPDPDDKNPANDTMPKKLDGGVTTLPISFTAPLPTYSTAFTPPNILVKVNNGDTNPHPVLIQVYAWTSGSWGPPITTLPRTAFGGDSTWGIPIPGPPRPPGTKFRVLIRDNTIASKPLLCEYEVTN